MTQTMVPRSVFVEDVMGTAVTLDVRGAEPGETAVRDCFRFLHQIDAAFSTYKPASEVNRYDRGELTEPSLDLAWVLERCEALREETRGYFDARATGRFDPSALVKGWAVQRAADALH